MTAAAPLKWRTDFDKFVVTSNFDRRGWWRWDPGDGDDWNVFWANVHTVKQIFDPSNGIRLGEHQIVNHFPNHYELTRKDLMVKNMRRYRKELEKEARERGDDASCVPDFVPLTFSLPADYSLFVEEFRRVPHATWIVKPTGKAQGKGIFLVNKLAQVKRWATGLHAPGVGARPSQASREEAHVVSRYVTDPLLVGGRSSTFASTSSSRPIDHSARTYPGSDSRGSATSSTKTRRTISATSTRTSRTSPSKNGRRVQRRAREQVESGESAAVPGEHAGTRGDGRALRGHQRRHRTLFTIGAERHHQRQAVFRTLRIRPPGGRVHETVAHRGQREPQPLRHHGG